MYNSEATNLSNQCLQEQIAFLTKSRPNLRQILSIDSITNMKADYLYSVDAVAIDSSGNSQKVQFKCRKEGNLDLILPAKKLTGNAANQGDIGFWYKDIKYAFYPTANIYVERIDGKDYSFTADDLHAIEAVHCDTLQNVLAGVRPKYVYADNGSKFPSGDFYVFIKPVEMLRLQVELFKRANPSFNYGVA